MSEITIQEGNRLIAEFMDGRVYDTEVSVKFYHSSWDWLMPVVLKISRTHSEMNCKKMDFYLLNMSICSTIDMAWDGVIEFIQWYNTQTSIK